MAIWARPATCCPACSYMQNSALVRVRMLLSLIAVALTCTQRCPYPHSMSTSACSLDSCHGFQSFQACRTSLNFASVQFCLNLYLTIEACKQAHNMFVFRGSGRSERSTHGPEGSHKVAGTEACAVCSTHVVSERQLSLGTKSNCTLVGALCSLTVQLVTIPYSGPPPRIACIRTHHATQTHRVSLRLLFAHVACCSTACTSC
jgi:hypothetical protein